MWRWNSDKADGIYVGYPLRAYKHHFKHVLRHPIRGIDLESSQNLKWDFRR